MSLTRECHLNQYMLNNNNNNNKSVSYVCCIDNKKLSGGYNYESTLI